MQPAPNVLNAEFLSVTDGVAHAPFVFTIAGAVNHFSPTSSLKHFGAKQWRSIHQPLVHLSSVGHGVFKTIASFPVSDVTEVNVGLKVSGEFLLLTRTGTVDAYQAPDWARLTHEMTQDAKPLCSADLQQLRQHLDRQWARAIEVAGSARRLKALLTCWQEQGVHYIRARLLAALGAHADTSTVNLVRSAGSRSAAVYNWLCVAEPLRTIRHTALKLEPALLTHAICHRSACTDQLLRAADQQAPLRAVIRQAFGLNHAEVRFLNRVIGAREVSVEVFETLMRHIASLPPEVRPSSFRGATALAMTHRRRMLDGLAFLFPERLCKALGPVTTLQHRQAAQKTWRRYVIEHHRAAVDGSTRGIFDPKADWVWDEDPDLEDGGEDAQGDQGWPALDEQDDFEFQVAGLTADDFFEEWLLGLPYQVRSAIHLKLCRLSVRKRIGYIEHWRYALLVSLKRNTVLHKVLPTLVASTARTFGFTAVPGQVSEFITAIELDAWNDATWLFVPLVSRASFELTAEELCNCADDPSLITAALVVRAFYARLKCLRTGEDTLIEFEIEECDQHATASSAAAPDGLTFSITQHSGINNRLASNASLAKAVQFLAWLNQQFGATARGRHLATLRRQIRSDVSTHLIQHRKEIIHTAAVRVHNQGLRWSPR